MTPEQIEKGNVFIAKQNRDFVSFVSVIETDTTFSAESKLKMIFDKLNENRKALTKFEKSIGIKD